MRLMLINPRESVFKVISDETALTSSLLREASTAARQSYCGGTQQVQDFT